MIRYGDRHRAGCISPLHRDMAATPSRFYESIGGRYAADITP